MPTPSSATPARSASWERFGFKPTGTVWYGEHEHVLFVLDAT